VEILTANVISPCTIERLNTLPFPASCNEFAGTHMEAPHDGCITRATYSLYTSEANDYREHSESTMQQWCWHELDAEIK
jgi:hypothetical protein